MIENNQKQLKIIKINWEYLNFEKLKIVEKYWKQFQKVLKHGKNGKQLKAIENSWKQIEQNNWKLLRTFESNWKQLKIIENN